MAGREVERRLVAIVSADVVGYSRLMEADEAGTLAALKARRAVTDPRITEYKGRIVGAAGDSLLIEFPSTAAAISCALDIQAIMAERNADVPLDQRMEYRIGVNLGDVMIEGDDVFGTGVNVAARLQELAEPGGIWISQAVHEQVRHSLDLRYEDQGEQRVKNISEPVRSYRIIVDPQEKVRQRFPTGRSRSKRRWAIGTVIAACVIAVAILGWSVLDTRKTDSSEAACTDHLGLRMACPEGQE